MAVAVQILEKLKRKMIFSLPVETIQSEVATRLKKLARTIKMDGFRPGKIPMNVVAQRYGYSVQSEVMNEKVARAFVNSASEAEIRVAGRPQINQTEDATEGELVFEAIFEVYPDVKIGDLETAEIEKVTTEVTDAAIDKTVDILRKQRRTFSLRPQDAAAQDGDRVVIDFEGKIDGEAFSGGKAEDFQFILGDGQMLKAFDEATIGLKVGESKTFPLVFPADYHGQDVAGKMADFMVTVKKIEAAHLPDENEALAKSLDIADASAEGLRADIKKNLEREVKSRLLARNKAAVMDALVAKAELDLPNASVQAEISRLLEGARADLAQRGVKDADKLTIPKEMFRSQAERRVRLGLVMAALVHANDLQAKKEQVKAHLEELAASYEKPVEVLRWYFSDDKRLAEIEAIVQENNVTDFVLSKAKVTEKAISFAELMA
ncbi:MAG: trigger factor [Rhodoferax sp.]|jgi:trigger factor|nr:trigger factor [Rhodoferax sp.]